MPDANNADLGDDTPETTLPGRLFNAEPDESVR